MAFTSDKRTLRIPILLIAIFLCAFLINTLEKESFKAATGRAFAKTEDGTINAFFCPEEECRERLIELISGANEVKCAFYTIDDKFADFLANKSKEINLSIGLDSDSYEKIKGKLNGNFFPIFSAGIMHNKFCIFDRRIVFTGSYNPTEGDSYYNNNNILVISSKTLAKNYESKFEELRCRNIGCKSVASRENFLKINEIPVENYFCPEDSCTDKLIGKIRSAKESILFMTFSFTEKKIAEEISEMQINGIEAKGVFEKRQESNYSVFKYLNESGVLVKLDENPYVMHHKVFIIDNETVITGSFNPSANANYRNDENILIIKDREIAARYLEEFSEVWNYPKNDAYECPESECLQISNVKYKGGKGKEIIEIYNPAPFPKNLEYIFIKSSRNSMRLSGIINQGSFQEIIPKFRLSDKNGTIFLLNSSRIIDSFSW
ncbi:MAG: phospholipase D-like domain-containing protein [Candidatus Woesearchaeota archaeon]|nr:phospholipase D-like domain-containing protein [Candidatus Woesearchaeota archaeon]